MNNNLSEIRRRPIPHMRTVTGFFVANLLENFAKNDDERLKILKIAADVVSKVEFDEDLCRDVTNLAESNTPKTRT